MVVVSHDARQRARKRFHLTRISSSDGVASGEMLHSSDADADAEYPHWVYGAAKYSNISSATAVAASLSKRCNS